MSKKDDTILFLMLQTIDKIFEYSSVFSNVDDFVDDGKSFDACMMNFIALGETISKLSQNFKDRNNHVDWNKIQAFRNIIAHDYFGIDEDEVWQIIKTHLPKLKADIENIIRMPTNQNHKNYKPH
ncbi:MAG: hypothetical protein DRI95_06110 [Bacteroidetes bacterium]|nr:MAG: hypothetical protein DRI95_06110 [Bacteroidota bacterium]RLD84002.1 MAG: hypothetical protein DRJ07_05665 [Bacteroidota bacterium]